MPEEFADAIRLFKAWYVTPLERLMEDGPDGGFIAFTIGIILFERLIDAKLKLKGVERSEDNKRKVMAEELGLSGDERKVFWDMFRNGLAHQGMPKVGPTGFMFLEAAPGHPIVGKYDQKPCVYINPWKFTQDVLDAYLREPELIAASDSYPLARVVVLDPNDVEMGSP